MLGFTHGAGPSFLSSEQGFRRIPGISGVTSQPVVALAVLAVVAVVSAARGGEMAGAKSDKEARRAETRWALLIGVDDYAELEKLRYCGEDMRALRERLGSSGFPEQQIFVLHDKAESSKYRPSKVNIERQLELVLGLVEREDMVLVAFSGHGVHFEGKSYLCPVEARLGEPQTMVGMEEVYQRLRECRAALKLMLVDACRNDPRLEGQRGSTRSAGVDKFAANLDRPPEGILLLNSCAPGQTSMEEKDFGHGVFMHFLLNGLRGKADADQNGRVSLMELYRYANRETKSYVARKYNGYQTPALRGDINDDFEITTGAMNAFAAAAMQRGVECRRKKEYAKALVELTEAIRLEPTSAEAFNYRGLTHSDTGNRQAALADYTQAIRLKPDMGVVYYNRGWEYEAIKEVDRAIEDYSGAIRLTPKGQYYHDRALLYIEKERYDEAIADCSEALRLEPNTPKFTNTRGYAYKCKGDFKAGMRDYTEAIRLKSDYRIPYGNRAHIHLANKDFQEAVADFTKAIDLGWTDAFMFYRRAEAYAGLKKHAEAIADFSEAIRHDSKYVRAYNRRGLLRDDSGDQEGALADYSAALRLDPKFPHAYYNRGLVYRERGDYDTAIADFNEAIRLSADDPDYFKARGRTYLRKKRYEQAIADFTQAIRIDPKNAWAYSYRGLAYSFQNDYDTAIADFNRAIQNDPEQAIFYENRAVAYRGKKWTKQAEADNQKAKALRVAEKFAPGRYATVAAASASVHDESAVIAQLSEGTRVKTLQVRGDWVLVETGGGQKNGWVQADQLK